MLTINIDLGAAVEVQALILWDHNLTATATITLIGALPTEFSEAVAWNDDTIIHYLSAATTKRYWHLQIIDAANTDGYIEVGELFLGSYLELTSNYIEGFDEETTFLKDTNTTPYGIMRDRFYNFQKTLNFDFNMMTAADVTSMKTLIAALGSRTTGIFKPFWFNLDSASPNDSCLVRLESLPVKHRTRSYYDIPLVMSEVVASV